MAVDEGPVYTKGKSYRARQMPRRAARLLRRGVPAGLAKCAGTLWLHITVRSD